MIRLALLVIAISLAGPGWACPIALALALDVSASVDYLEHRAQREGTAAALVSPEVAEGLTGGRLMIYEWAGKGTQTVIVPWTTVTGPETLVAVAAALDAPRRTALGETTALGQAIMFGGMALLTQECDRRVLDVSSDGENNDGPHPEIALRELRPHWIEINALVVSRNDREAERLVGYYERQVINGPFRFVERARGYEAYAEAIKRKLVTELNVAWRQE